MQFRIGVIRLGIILSKGAVAAEIMIQRLIGYDMMIIPR